MEDKQKVSGCTSLVTLTILVISGNKRWKILDLRIPIFTLSRCCEDVLTAIIESHNLKRDLQGQEI